MAELSWATAKLATATATLLISAPASSDNGAGVLGGQGAEGEEAEQDQVPAAGLISAKWRAELLQV